MDTQTFRDAYKQRPAYAATMTIGQWLNGALKANNKTLAAMTNVDEALRFCIAQEYTNWDRVGFDYWAVFNSFNKSLGENNV